MLGGSCSPCCGCSPSTAHSLWQSLTAKTFNVSFSTSIPKCDAATIANRAYSELAQYGSPLDLTYNVNNTIYGYAFTSTQRDGFTEFVEGHDAYSQASLALALDMSSTAWNATTNTGTIKFVYASFPYNVALTLSVAPSNGECSVQASMLVAVKARSAISNFGAGNLNTPTVQVVQAYQSLSVATYTYALVEAPYYNLTLFPINANSFSNAPVDVSVYDSLLYSTGNSKFASVSAAWDESKKPSSLSWSEYDIVSTAITLDTAQLVSGGVLTGQWSGEWNKKPRQWVSNNRSEWASSLSLVMNVIPDKATTTMWGYSMSGIDSPSYHLTFSQQNANRAYVDVHAALSISASVSVS